MENRACCVISDFQDSIVYLLLSVLLEHFIWTRHHCQWKAASLRLLLGTDGIGAGRVPYCKTPAVTQDLDFLSHLVWHILTWSLTKFHIFKNINGYYRCIMPKNFSLIYATEILKFTENSTIFIIYFGKGTLERLYFAKRIKTIPFSTELYVISVKVTSRREW